MGISARRINGPRPTGADDSLSGTDKSFLWPKNVHGKFRTPVPFSDYDVGWKETVQRPLPVDRFEVGRGYEVRRLSFCMDSGIGLACADQIYFFLCNEADFVFDDSLNALGVGLPLPTVVGGSVIL